MKEHKFAAVRPKRPSSLRTHFLECKHIHVPLPVVAASEEGRKDKNRNEVSTFYPVVSVNTLPS